MKKQKMLKSVLSLALALIMVFGAVPAANFAGLIASAVDVREGTPTVSKGYWEYYDDGEIVFKGQTIKALTDADVTPWTDKDGANIVDSISSVTIANTVNTIGANGFKLLKVDAVGIPKTVTAIDSNAFSNSSIKSVYFEGSQAEWKAIFTANVDGLRVYFSHKHTGGILKHSYAATCTKKGYEGDKYCSQCGAFYAKGGYTEKSDHKWSSGYAYITGMEPTCSKGGYQAKFCEVCGVFDFKTQTPVPATGEHDWVVQDGDKFTNCQSKLGEQIVMHCKNCNLASNTKDEKNGIDFTQLTYKYKTGEKDKDGKDIIVDSGETDLSKLTATQQKNVVNGEQVQYNQWLKKYSTVQIDNNGNAIHHYVNTVTEPTCTQDGKTVVTCEWCNDYNYEYVLPATGHSDVQTGNVINYEIPATCTEPGERGSRCTICGDVLYSEVIPNNHTKGYYSGTWKTLKSPNCVEDGYQWLVCNYCGDYIKDENGDNVQRTLNKTPDVHTASRWFTTLEPTCTEKGEQVKICTVKGCPYYSDTVLGKAVVKISDRKALDNIIAVTKDVDVNRVHFFYSDSGLTNDEQVYDVANEINMAILAAYQKGDSSKLADNLTKIFETAVTYHGYIGTRKDGTEGFIFDEESYDVDDKGNVVTTCVAEPTGDVRYVFSEIIAEAVKQIIARESVINTTNDIVAILEQAWTDLGTAEIKTVIDANRDLIAKITDKSLAKQEIDALGHDYVRCAYIVVNNEFIPVCQKAGDTAWYKIASYNADGEPVASDEKVEGNAVTEVNCIDGGGNMISQCRRCMKLAEPKLVLQGSHDLKTKKIAATCYENGYDHTYCTKCDYYKDVDTDIKLTHNYVETIIKESTCSKAGIKVKICSYCGDVDKSTYQTLDLLPHSDSPVNEPATCTESGRNGMVCSVCGRFSGEILPALDHNYVKNVTPPSCTEIGYTVSTCSRCGDTQAPTDFVPARGHQFGKAINVAPSCEKGSYTFEQCSVCGYKKEYNQKPNALGHILATIPAVEPDCTHDGHTEKVYCTRDGCTYVQKEAEVIPALGHVRKTAAYKAPTCEEKGHQVYDYCDRCKAELTEKVEIPALGHNEVIDPRIEPTCVKDGYTEGSHCSRCSKVLKPQIKIPKNGHKFGGWVVTKEGTIFRPKEMQRTCTVCGAIETEPVPLTLKEKIVWLIEFILGNWLTYIGM